MQCLKLFCICLRSGKHDSLLKTTFVVLFFLMSGSAYGAGGKNASEVAQLLLSGPVSPAPELLHITPAVRALWTVV